MNSGSAVRMIRSGLHWSCVRLPVHSGQHPSIRIVRTSLYTTDNWVRSHGSRALLRSTSRCSRWGGSGAEEWAQTRREREKGTIRDSGGPIIGVKGICCSGTHRYNQFLSLIETFTVGSPVTSDKPIVASRHTIIQILDDGERTKKRIFEVWLQRSSWLVKDPW